MRKACYEEHHDVCEICGQRLTGKRGLELPLHNAHECYELDYENYIMEFKRLVCCCPTCHACIHSGRTLTNYLNHIPLYDQEYMYGLAKHAFGLVHNWNKLHPDDEPLQLYRTFKDWVAEPTLHHGIKMLVIDYHIGFYEIPNRAEWDNAFDKWRMIYDGEEYPSLFQSREEWGQTMAARDRGGDTGPPLFEGEAFSQLRAIIKKGE